MIDKPKSRQDWLSRRKRGIGASDSGAVLGLNKYRNNVDVYNEKTGKIQPEDISGKPNIVFGKKAERLIRELFKLNHSEYRVTYHEYWMYHNDEYPFIYATLDGELTEKRPEDYPKGKRFNPKRGILEIKTTTITGGAAQWSEWEDKIPDSYYTQCLHQLLATGWDFVILVALIRYYRGSELRQQIREYRIDRADHEDELAMILDEEKAFWASVESGNKPAMKLPEI